MDAKMKGLAAAYDEKYRQGHYFSYREWLYRPYIKALIKKANLQAGSSVLDVGCGQGFFSWLFADFGLKPVGVDVSAEAIRSANKYYGSSGARFEVGDILSSQDDSTYGCIFVRGLSAYNSTEFEQSRSVTDALLKYLEPGGMMIFCYHTNFCPRKKSETWIYHSIRATEKHFSKYPGAKVYFSLRTETLLFGRISFQRSFTFLSAMISRITGLGGELVALVPRSAVGDPAQAHGH